MQQRRALGDAGRAAGVLQHRDVARPDVGRAKAIERPARYGVLNW
jgi:hypothetical protein